MAAGDAAGAEDSFSYLVFLRAGFRSRSVGFLQSHLRNSDLLIHGFSVKPVTHEPGDGTQNSRSGSPKPAVVFTPRRPMRPVRLFGIGPASAWSSGTKWRALSALCWPRSRQLDLLRLFQR